MSTKKIAIVAKPTAKPVESADTWVDSRASASLNEGQEKMKRLTIDIPDGLHRQIKADCAMRGTKIADEVRELLTQKYRKA